MQRLLLIFLGLAVSGMAINAAWAADDAGHPPIKEIMKKAFKKPMELQKRVVKGVADAAETKELLNLFQSLAAQSPPRGEQDSWQEKTGLLVEAAQAAVAGEADAGTRLRKAANCAACHKIHKPAK
jgi:hypothetical protein